MEVATVDDGLIKVEAVNELTRIGFKEAPLRVWNPQVLSYNSSVQRKSALS